MCAADRFGDGVHGGVECGVVDSDVRSSNGAGMFGAGMFGVGMFGAGMFGAVGLEAAVAGSFNEHRPEVGDIGTMGFRMVSGMDGRSAMAATVGYCAH